MFWDRVLEFIDLEEKGDHGTFNCFVRIVKGTFHIAKCTFRIVECTSHNVK